LAVLVNAFGRNPPLESATVLIPVALLFVTVATPDALAVVRVTLGLFAFPVRDELSASTGEDARRRANIPLGMKMSARFFFISFGWLRFDLKGLASLWLNSYIVLDYFYPYGFKVALRGFAVAFYYFKGAFSQLPPSRLLNSNHVSVIPKRRAESSLTVRYLYRSSDR
jgi:hypothetical protein